MKVGYNLAKAGSFAKLCLVKTVKRKWENDKRRKLKTT